MTEQFKTFESTKFEIVDSADDFASDEEREAFASVTSNPTATWVKFILTDDIPNENRQRVPEDEFSNLIKSGQFMPIKMAEAKINDGHPESFPLGVITHLKQFKNQIIGLAALWQRERPEDVALVKEKFANKEPLELSWEILHTGSTFTDDGVEELRGTVLRAVTFVGQPAYAGRTPVLAVAATQADSTVEDTKLEELQKLQEEKEGLVQALAQKEEELKSINEELSSLREYKDVIEKAKEELVKIDEIKTKFAEAGISKTEEYFVTNKDMLLGLTPGAFDFMVQELVAFASARQAESSLKTDNGVPNLNALPGAEGEPSLKDLADFLRKNAKK